MPIYNTELRPNGLMEEINAKYSGIRAYGKNSQGRYLQIVLLSGRWICEEKRREDLLKRMDEFAFSAGQETFAPSYSDADSLIEQCEEAISTRNGGNWDRILISVVMSMTDADEDPSTVSALDMAAELKKYLDENYAVNSSVVFYGIFTRVKKVACAALRDKLSEFQSAGVLQDIFHVVSMNNSETNAVQTVAFSSDILMFCMDAENRDSTQYSFNEALKKTRSDIEKSINGKYSFKLIDSLFLNVQKAAAIKYSYDILDMQSGAVQSESDAKEWEVGLHEFVCREILRPITENESNDFGEELKKRIIQETGMLPILPQKTEQGGGFGFFRRHNRTLMEDPKTINNAFYGKLDDGKSTLERYIEKEIDELRAKLDTYSDEKFQRALVRYCPNIDFARSAEFIKGLNRQVDNGFAGFISYGKINTELDADESANEVMKKKSLYCRDYYITTELKQFFDAYMKKRLSSAAEMLSKESNTTVNDISDMIAKEKNHLRNAWMEYMGSEIEGKQIVSVQQKYTDPMNGVNSEEFAEKIRNMSDEQRNEIVAAFLKRAEEKVHGTRIVSATSSNVMQLFVHNTKYLTPKGYSVYDINNGNMLDNMLASFSVRPFSANDSIIYYL